jgi:hypothetical protein
MNAATHGDVPIITLQLSRINSPHEQPVRQGWCGSCSILLQLNIRQEAFVHGFISLYCSQALVAQTVAAQALETELLQAREAQVVEREAAAAQLAAAQANLEAARQAHAELEAQLEAAQRPSQELEEQRQALQAAQSRVTELERDMQVCTCLCVPCCCAALDIPASTFCIAPCTITMHVCRHILIVICCGMCNATSSSPGW